VVGRAGLAAVELLDDTVPPDQHAPAARAGVALAGAVGPHLDVVDGVAPGLRCARLGRGHAFASAAVIAEVTSRSLTEPAPNPGPVACSGCGIRPTTLPRALVMPAMSRREPLGLTPV